MKGILLLVLLGSVGCATTGPGKVEVRTDSYDQSIITEMQPGWATDNIDSPGLRIGVTQNSKHPDQLLLLVRSIEIKHFSLVHPNLDILIDGKEQHLSPTSKITNCTTDGVYTNDSYCEQTYVVNTGLLEQLVNAKTVGFKVHLIQDKYVSGSLGYKGEWSAYKGLQSFLSKIKK